MKLRRAFTLAEVLIAIAITGLMLTALAMVTENVLRIWAAQAEDPLFDRHVDGLRRALEECLAETADAAAGTGTTASTQATLAVSGSRSGNNSATGRVRSASAVFTAAPADASVEYAPYLRVTGAPPFLEGTTMPLGFVHAWLLRENDGDLVLYWQTDDDRRETPDSARRLVLSPWCESITFLAYDSTNEVWNEFTEADPEQVPPNAAVFMRIRLNHRGQTREFTLTLTDTLPFNLNY
ncbi:MAG: prepilin-type N-terminal cleavage/methylation domain-containing protein [Puniceicoccales bacterium]|jgi:prepilin-type N-terminal cleavage/methylation domain-containing protein|nr:prepilin-type N-terminal cleavage/methylation domain-containing protein [Puniceicoccales bacterium]